MRKNEKQAFLTVYSEYYKALQHYWKLVRQDNNEQNRKSHLMANEAVQALQDVGLAMGLQVKDFKEIQNKYFESR